MMASNHAGAPSAGAGDLSPTGNPSGASSNPKMRKRTKTGCLTCRKRRIKCGEERPTCANCIKSKRQCEGYNQRVVFKTPIENWPNHPGHVSTIQYHTSMLPGSRNQSYRPSQPAPQVQDPTQASIQPRPLDTFNFAHVEQSPSTGVPTSQHVLVGGTTSFAHDGAYQQPLVSPHQQPLISPHHQHPLQSPHHHTPMSNTAGSYFPQQSPVHTSPPPMQYSHEPNTTYQAPAHYPQSQPSYQQGPISYDQGLDSKVPISQALPPQSLYQHRSSNSNDEQRSYHSHSSVSPRSDHYPSYPDTRPTVQRYNSLPQIPTHQMPASSAPMGQASLYDYATPISHADFSHPSYSSAQIPLHDLSSDVKYMPQPVLEQSAATSRARGSHPQLLLRGFGGDDHVSPTQILDEAAVENEDDDYWDVHSDEEMVDADDGMEDDTALASKEFNMIRQIHQETSNELGVRRYDAFLYDGLLSHYRPEYAASPLRNAKTARVFAHFIHVTGPTLSAYERNPRNSALIFEDSTPTAQQGLWTYILPLKALSHQGLLHAMLAIASLHIARLQGASITPSYKHYAYSLKRLGRSLGNPKRRHSIPTLATSLLLAYYEVWTAEHVKWSTHLVGAAQLLTELDFRSLTREARRLRASQSTQDEQIPWQNPDTLINQKQLNQRIKDNMMMPDEALVSTLVGKKVSYDDFGMVIEDPGMQGRQANVMPGGLDLRSYETLQDLHWWYARHDVFQSIISGNPLIQAYRKWSDCPPRAPLGRSDALYGTNDHMILLLGRIADFTVRDRIRKLKQVKADGGWRPRPEMPGFGGMGPPHAPGSGMSAQPPTPPTPMGPPSHMQGPPSGWTGPPPAGWKGPPPSGFAPSAGGLPTPTEGSKQVPNPGAPPSTPSFFGMAPAGPTVPLPPSYENPDYQRTPPSPNTPLPMYANLPEAYQTALQEWDEISAAHASLAQTLTNSDAFAPLPLDIAPPVPGSDGNMTPFGPALVHRSYDISLLWTFVHLCKIILLRSHPAMPPAAQMAAGVCAQATGPYATLIGRITAGMRIPVSEDLSPSLGVVLTESTMSLFFAGVQYQNPKQREWLVTRLLEIDRRTGWASAGIIARGCETAWEKAADLGRGPPYTRRTRRAGEEGPLVLDPVVNDGPSTWRSKEKDDYGKGMSGMYQDADESETRRRESVKETVKNEEKGFIMKSRAMPWAMNILATEEELRVGIENVGL